MKGLVDAYPEGLDALDASAQDTYGKSFATLSVQERQGVIDGSDRAFVAMLWGHVVEGTWGDPVYGGNAGMSGWKMIGYEGDRQPVGFSARQMSNPEEG